MNSPFETYLNTLMSYASPEEGARLAAYHKVPRIYLGVRVPQITTIAKEYCKIHTETEILALCPALWKYNAHETRLSIGKLLEQKNIKNFSAIWQLLEEFKSDFNSWAIPDHLTHGADKVLKAEPKYLDILENYWLTDANFWVRRCTLVFTLYLAKKGQDPTRPLEWAASMVTEKEWFIQKAIAWWLRELSKHSPEKVQEFLGKHKSQMKAFAVKEAGKYL